MLIKVLIEVLIKVALRSDRLKGERPWARIAPSILAQGMNKNFYSGKGSRTPAPLCFESGPSLIREKKGIPAPTRKKYMHSTLQLAGFQS